MEGLGLTLQSSETREEGIVTTKRGNIDRHASTCPSCKHLSLHEPLAYPRGPRIVNGLAALLSAEVCVGQRLPLSANQYCLQIISKGQSKEALVNSLGALPTSPA